MLLQFAVRDQDERKINTRFAPHIVPRVLGTVPGIIVHRRSGPAARLRGDRVLARAGVARCRAQRVIMADEVLVLVRVAARPRSLRCLRTPDDRAACRSVRLCLARSGDKGDTANIGVIARSEAIYAWMLEHLTAGVRRSGTSTTSAGARSSASSCRIFWR